MSLQKKKEFMSSSSYHAKIQSFIQLHYYSVQFISLQGYMQFFMAEIINIRPSLTTGIWYLDKIS